MAVTSTTLDGYFKERYEDRLEDIVPQFEQVAADVGFDTAKKLGEKFEFAVRLRRTHGVTFYGSDLDAFDLNDPVSGQTKAASVQGTQFVLRDRIAYGVVSAAQSSKEAFGKAMDDVVMDIVNSASFYREMCLLYGGSSIGEITGYANPVATITVASWAAGLWAQMEGAKVDVYDAPGGTKRNTVGALTVSAIDPDPFTRTVTFTGDAADLAAVTNGDVIIPFGADGNWFDGLDVLVPNTGVMHGIDASTYMLWKGNSYGAGTAALTFAKMNAATSEVAVRCGLGKLVFYCSPYTWADLNDDAAALRRYVASTKGSLDLGTQKITYYGPAGEMEIKPHPMVKAGEAFGIMPQYFKRIGSTDITFRLPGVEGQEPRFFRELGENAGFELRCFWHQALASKKPAAHVKITGIDNDSI